MSWKNWNGKTVLRDFRKEASEALMGAGEATKAQVLQEIPHDEGTLSQTVVVMKDPQNDLRIYLAAGGGGVSGFPVVPYAVKWHFVEANFQKGRKRYYISDPMKQVFPRALKSALRARGLK